MPLTVVGLAIQAGGLTWVALLASAGSAGYGRYVVPFVIAGVGISMSIPTVPTAALSAVLPADIGQASGVKITMQRFGGAFGIALASAVFAVPAVATVEARGQHAAKVTTEVVAVVDVDT
ncbi:MAG TPA: hypothetical protein VHT26_16245 [Trebonia sp.]|nr:hypothetical protein [Trebonia sp.]